MYAQFARWAPRLKRETDYTVEEKTRSVILTDAGIDKLEQLAGVKNIYAEENLDLTRYMENALKAEIIFTWNCNHFRRISPSFADRIQEPS